MSGKICAFAFGRDVIELTREQKKRIDEILRLRAAPPAPFKRTAPPFKRTPINACVTGLPRK